MSAIISDRFRIYNAEQFLSALGDDYYDEENQPVVGPLAERSRMYFFVGRPQNWYAYVEIYSNTGTFQENEVVNGSANNFNAVVRKVYESALLLESIGGDQNLNTKPAVGDVLTGATSGATALTGLYRYGTEDSVPEALDNDAEFYEVYDDLISAKRMTIEYTRGVVRRYTWSLSASETYDMYRPDYSKIGPGITGKVGSSTTGQVGAPATSLGTSKFYVINQDYEVFKCIYNGSAGHLPNGIPATRVPSRTPGSGEGLYDDPATGGSGVFFENINNLTLSEYRVSPTNGYLWKFMFKLPINDVLRFLSTDFMPVPLSVSGNGSDRQQTEAAAEDGAIFSVLIENRNTTLANGSNYFAPIVGDGTGGIVQLFVDSGLITGINIVNRGTGYTYASVPLENGTSGSWGKYGLFSDSGLTTAISGLTKGTVGAVEPIIGPKGGHGANCEAEFNTKRIMANVRLSYAEGSGDFPVDNDFRRIGILKDPKNSSDGLNATALTLTNLNGLYVADALLTDYEVDEEITQTRADGSVAKGRVVSWVNNGDGTGYIKYYQSRIEHTWNGTVRPFEDATVVGAGPIVGTNSGSSFDLDTFTGVVAGLSFTDGVAPSEFERNSGDVIYLENRRLITRAPDQIEDIKLVIEF